MSLPNFVINPNALVPENGRSYTLPDTKSGKSNLFGANKEIVMKYVDDNDLDVDKDEDLLKIVIYYHSLEK